MPVIACRANIAFFGDYFNEIFMFRFIVWSPMARLVTTGPAELQLK